MTDKKDNESRKALVEEIAWIFGFGGIGGALVWIWEIWQGTVVWELQQLLYLAMYIGFGAGAAAVFILLIANSDRSDRMRIVALALLSGFVWKPIWNSSQHYLVGQEEKKSPIDSPADEVDSSGIDESSVESLYEGFNQFIGRFIDERIMQETDFRKIPKLSVGEVQEVQGDEFRFAIGEGRLVISTQAENADLVGTLYQYNSGELKYLAIDDDSGILFNPKIDLQVESGEYLLTLKSFEEDALYDGPVNILVRMD